MSQSYRLRFLLFALPFIVAIALLAAIQPRMSAASPAPAFFRSHPMQWHRPGGGFGGTLPRGARRGPAGGYPFMMMAAPQVGYTVNGWRLLAALALTGAFTGLVWLTLDNGPIPVQSGNETLREQDIARLREEVDSLQREQRHLRETLDWQQRLLTSEHGPERDAT